MDTKTKTEKKHHKGRNGTIIGSKTFINIDQIRKSSKVCSRCGRAMVQGEKFLFLERHRHTFLVCGPCLVLAAAEVMKDNPAAKAEAMVELL
jgi:ribosomal protein S27AE